MLEPDCGAVNTTIYTGVSNLFLNGIRPSNYQKVEKNSQKPPLLKYSKVVPALMSGTLDSIG